MRRSLFILLAILAAPATAQAQSLVRHPYLQKVTETSAVIVWRTDVASDGLVRYGAAPDQLTQMARSAASGTHHEVTLPGLQPGRRYYYAVSAGSAMLAGGDADHYVDTAPPRGSRPRIRAWLVGDSGTGDSRQAAVRDAMLRFVGADRPQLYLHVGDMAYDAGTTAEFTDNFFTPYASILRNTVTWPAIGNHEGSTSDSASESGPYYDAYVLPRAAEAGGVASGTEAYYSFDWGNAHFIVLDSHESPRTPGGAMLSWLRRDLEATDQEWVIAYWHHPPYTKGSHDSDDESQLIEMRENALPILEAAGVDLVLAGHSHIYERSFLLDGAYATPTTAAGHIKDMGDGKPLGSGPYKKSAARVTHEGAVYVVAGHGGASISGSADHPVMYFSELQHGSCILDLQENRLELVNIRRDGMLTDRFAMVKGRGLVLASPAGGEHYRAGDRVGVRWATVGDVPAVDLLLSPDGGATWMPLAEDVANTGSHEWTVPDIDAPRALLRVQHGSDAAIHDDSNAAFSIGYGAAPFEAIPFGDTWRFSDDGTDHAAAFRAAGFDDSSWREGPAQLGYGEDDQATTLEIATPRHPSVYFRKVITVAGEVTAAHLRVLHDDGFAVWVNGVEVQKKYMDGGTDHGTFASSASTDNELTEADILTSPFVAGSNVVAVMVKQSSGTSSDLSFDLGLDLTVRRPGGGGGAGGGGLGGGGAGGAGGGGAAGGAAGGGAAGSGGGAAGGGVGGGAGPGGAGGTAGRPGGNGAGPGGGMDTGGGCAIGVDGAAWPFAVAVFGAALILVRRRRR